MKYFMGEIIALQTPVPFLSNPMREIPSAVTKLFMSIIAKAGKLLNAESRRLPTDSIGVWKRFRGMADGPILPTAYFGAPLTKYTL